MSALRFSLKYSKLLWNSQNLLKYSKLIKAMLNFLTYLKLSPEVLITVSWNFRMSPDEFSQSSWSFPNVYWVFGILRKLSELPRKPSPKCLKLPWSYWFFYSYTSFLKLLELTEKAGNLSELIGTALTIFRTVKSFKHALNDFCLSKILDFFEFSWTSCNGPKKSAGNALHFSRFWYLWTWLVRSLGYEAPSGTWNLQF